MRDKWREPLPDDRSPDFGLRSDSLLAVRNGSPVREVVGAFGDRYSCGAVADSHRLPVHHPAGLYRYAVRLDRRDGPGQMGGTMGHRWRVPEPWIVLHPMFSLVPDAPYFPVSSPRRMTVRAVWRRSDTPSFSKRRERCDFTVFSWIPGAAPIWHSLKPRVSRWRILVSRNQDRPKGKYAATPPRNMQGQRPGCPVPCPEDAPGPRGKRVDRPRSHSGWDRYAYPPHRRSSPGIQTRE